MDVTTEREDGVLTARVEGRIDGATAVRFEEAVRTAMEEGDRGLVIDCGKLSFISSAGLRAVLLTAKALRGRNAGFALCAMSDPVREVFRISGFDSIVAIHPTRADALASFDS
ncbi:MAG: STAS domain-containing protein [Defluviicoccus sp.]|nr:STAS domain-containing protein [Defluviicoccus sp.]MDE0278799.1 STAS domain-containing protein [Defluviicoccus sp.]